MKTFVCVALFSLLAVLSACTPDAPQSGQNAPESPVADAPPNAPAPAPAPAPIKVAATLVEEIDSVKPAMADFNEVAISPGAVLLSVWSSEKMKWSELQAIPLGKYGMVMKDPDSQRGERICVTGQIVEILADNSLPSKIYTGGLVDEELRIYRFVAVKSSGDLVAGSQARFCGVITGRNDYSNSAGGVAHAVHLVGMFDLPENKTKPGIEPGTKQNTES